MLLRLSSIVLTSQSAVNNKDFKANGCSEEIMRPTILKTGVVLSDS